MTKNNEKDKMTFDDFDKLNLKGFAENLLQSIEKGVASSVIEKGAYTVSLNAKFGNGKTTFLKMFESFIKEQKNYNVLFINAWESDFYKEPIVTILSEFTYLMETIKIDAKKIKEILGSIVNQSILSKTGFNLKNMKNSIKIGEKLFNDFKDRKEMVTKIKEAVEEHTKDKKLFIIVDELDRARPDYAVHFLEDMKHFFDIENIIFLIAVNREQIEMTCKCLYGENLDFEGYYRKFFKMEIDLPDPYKGAQRLVDNLIKKTNVKFDKELDHRDHRINTSYLSCKIFNLSLREVETFIRIFEMIAGDSNHQDPPLIWSYMDCYSFFICLYLKDRKTFKKILNGNFTVDDFFQFVDEKNINYRFNERPSIEFHNNLLLGIVAYSFIKQRTTEDIEKVKTKFKAVADTSQLKHLFDYHYDQPALEICNKINLFKSAFHG